MTQHTTRGEMWGSMLSAFIISFGGSLAGGMVAGPQTQHLYIPPAVLIMAFVFGSMGAAKDYRSIRKLPPVNGKEASE